MSQSKSGSQPASGADPQGTQTQATGTQGSTPGTQALNQTSDQALNQTLDQFTAQDFLPASRVGIASSLSRPSLSYWQDAWRRLRKNKQSLASLFVVAFLLAFVFVGPLVWTIDPNHQDQTQTSIGLSAGATAVVIGNREDWAGVDAPVIPADGSVELTAPTNLRTVDTVSTLGVRIVWDPVPGAVSYAIYRNEIAPEPDRLGVPLGNTQAPERVSFEDIESLKTRRYYYSVVAVNAAGVESTKASTLNLDVKPGMSLELAQESKPDSKVGDTIALAAAPLGTDSLGRDLLARLMFGGKISIFIGLFAAFLETLIGTVIGGVSGFFGGRIDNYIMRVTDFVLGLPFLLFVILLKVAMGIGPGESGITALIIALVILSWPGAARLVRGQVLQLRESEFIHAARMMGARPRYLLMRHMFPNLLGILLVSLTFNIPSAIFAEAFLSFIGLGVAAPAASWGSLCNDSIQNILTHPHEFLAPAVAISLTVLAFNLLGDGLRDALDPKMRANE